MAANHHHPSLLLTLTLIFLLFTTISSHGDHNDEEEPSSSDPTEKPNLRSKSLILVKIWCLILVFIATFSGGVSPYFLKWNEGFLVLGVQFAGGVFLGTALMHFLSDSNETFGDLSDKEYPFAFMLACSGYLFTMLADCIISHVYSKVGSHSDEEVGVQQQPQPEKAGSELSNHDSHIVKPSLSTARSLGDSILLIVALCSHSVFEGIAIGVAETKADAWRALWTVSLHKVFAAIAMGIALLRMIPDRPLLSCAAYAFAFAISSPIGVAIGIVIDSTTQGQVADWIYAISMGIACGVFIYVAINHLLSKGYSPTRSSLVDKPLYKFLAVTLGVGVIAVVMIWD